MMMMKRRKRKIKIHFRKVKRLSHHLFVPNGVALPALNDGRHSLKPPSGRIIMHNSKMLVEKRKYLRQLVTTTLNLGDRQKMRRC